MIHTDTSIISSKQQIIIDAVNEITKENPSITQSPRKFLETVNDRVIFKMIDYFPEMCIDAFKINQAKKKIMQEVGHKGKYTDTYGWSEDGTMFFDYEIPPDLYTFMMVAVYKVFWESDNEKVWRGFMKKICDGKGPLTSYEALALLVKVKQIYGANSDQSLTA